MIAREELLQRFKAIASKVAEREVALTSADTAIADLGLDSLNLLEIIGEMEKELRVRIPDDQLVGITTVAQLVDLVYKRLPQG
ncbi:MAG: acyl carrier protein [Polyangiales bacterium]|jgi:acyl carrier protein